MEDTNAEKTLEISVTGEGVSITQEVDQRTAREIINILMGGSPEYTRGSRPFRQGRSDTEDSETRTQRPLSLREYLDETEARRNPDKIVAIGEYMSEHEEVPEFSRDDVKSRFKLAGEAAPRNFARDFAWAVSNGWVAEDPKTPGSFYVTKKGRDAIDAKFAADVAKSTRQKPGGRRRSSKRGIVRSNGGDE